MTLNTTILCSRYMYANLFFRVYRSLLWLLFVCFLRWITQNCYLQGKPGTATWICTISYITFFVGYNCIIEVYTNLFFMVYRNTLWQWVASLSWWICNTSFLQGSKQCYYIPCTNTFMYILHMISWVLYNCIIPHGLLQCAGTVICLSPLVVLEYFFPTNTILMWLIWHSDSSHLISLLWSHGNKYVHMHFL